MDLLKRLDGMSPQRLKLLALELDEKVQRAETARAEPIAIIGIGCRVPGADSPAEYWELLDKGRDAIREVPADRWNADDYFDSDPDAPGSVSSRSGGFLRGVDLFDARIRSSESCWKFAGRRLRMRGSRPNGSTDRRRVSL